MERQETYTTEEVRAELIEMNAIIAKQNDSFRQTWGANFTIPGRIVKTASVAAMPFETQVQIMTEVMQFNTFDDENDPYESHSFGCFTVKNGQVEITLYWKIDLYDADCVLESDAPTDPTQTTRVLTIMQPHEW